MMRIHPALHPPCRARPVTPPYPPATAVRKNTDLHSSLKHAYTHHMLRRSLASPSKMMRVRAPRTWLQRPPAVRRSRSSRWPVPTELRGCWGWAEAAASIQKAPWTAALCGGPPGVRSPGPAWRTCSASTQRPTRAQCGWARRTDGVWCTNTNYGYESAESCTDHLIPYNLSVSISIHVYQSSDNIRNRKNSMKMQHSASILCVLWVGLLRSRHKDFQKHLMCNYSCSFDFVFVILFFFLLL